MKQENTNKKKPWLWLVIGLALLAAVGVVLALVLGGSGEAGKTSVDGRADLYWNVDKAFYTENSETGLSTREPEADGLFHIKMAYNGEQVELTAADKQLVNYIDSLEVMSLTLDNSGNIIDVMDPSEVATVVGKNIYVQNATADMIVANSSIAMNGMRFNVPVTELTQIYEVSGSGKFVGQIVDTSTIKPMDAVYVYSNDQGEVTHVFLASHATHSSVYWRAEQCYDSTLKETSRVPDENGVYSVDFYCDGELVTLKTKDRTIVTSIDYKNVYRCHFGFEFDEEGYIVKSISSNLGIQGLLVGDASDVTAIDGENFTLNSYIYNVGTTWSGTITEDTLIYDVSSAAFAEGRKGKQVESLQVGDRVCAWTDTQGNVILVYVANRLVDSDVYYMETRKYDSTLKETTRKPNSNGYYEVELLRAGDTYKQTYYIKDKAMASYMDSQNNRTIGLKVGENNIVEYVYDSQCLFGITVFSRGGVVTDVQGLACSIITYGNRDSTRTRMMVPECKVYNVSSVGQYGAETTLQPGDRVYAHKQVTGEIVFVFVIQRTLGEEYLYWNLDLQYDSKNKTSTREPDADGWYWFNMAHQGKLITLKTKDKSIVNELDAQSVGGCGLIVENGIIKDVFDSNCAYGGSKLASGYRIKEIRSDGTVLTFYSSGTTYKEKLLKLADDCVFYNISDAYYDHKGEVTSTLKVGDLITAYADYYNDVHAVYVRYREADNMYWKTDRYYDTVNKVTTRVPDENGWYIFDLAVNGTVKTYKTQDKDLATKLDAYSTAFGLVVDGDVIRSFVPTNWVKGVGFVGLANWEIIAIKGDQVTVKYTLPGSSNTGKTQTITLDSNAKIYDVSPSAENFGAATTLKVGDQLRTYYNESNEEHLYVYVLNRSTRVKGADSYCEHCDQVVHWNPYSGGSITRTNGHYYLSGDSVTASQLGVGTEASDYEIVLDLNGFTLTVVDGRFALVRFNDTLTIMDTVGDGKVQVYADKGYNGGVVYVEGGHLNLMGGTLESLDSGDSLKWGGVVYLEDATFNMSGGTLVGGIADRGGAIYNTGASVLNITGGTITGGYSANNGGNIHSLSNSTLNISGGTITGGYAEGRGGNILVESGTFEISGGSVTGGDSVKANDDICIASSNANITVSGNPVIGKLYLRYVGTATVSGTPKISNLEIASGKLLTLGQLSQGAQIGVSAVGVFTNDLNNAENYSPYFSSVAEGMEVTVNGNALAVESEKQYCAHCDTYVSWYPWDVNNGGNPADAHYYLEDDYVQNAQRTINGNVVLDLKGHMLTTEGNHRLFLIKGEFSLLDTVGGGVAAANGHYEDNAGGNGGVAYFYGGTMNLYGGTLTLTENHNPVVRGGVLYVGSNTLNMYGGTISGGAAEEYGSNIFLSSGTFNMSGGTIDGGIYNSASANITLSSDAKITNNDNGLRLSSDTRINLEEMITGAEIYVKASGVFTNQLDNAESFLAYIKSVDDTMTVQAVGNTLSIVDPNASEDEDDEENIAKFNAVYSQAVQMTADNVFASGQTVTADCPYCGAEDAQWTALEAATSKITLADTASHYYLADNCNDNTSYYEISGTVCLHLNGYNITSTSRVFSVTKTGTLNIMGDGIVSGSYAHSTNTTHGSTIDLLGDLNLCGGTYVRTDAQPIITGRATLDDSESRSANIYEGTLIQGDTTYTGNALVHISNSYIFNMYGGTVTGGINEDGLGGNIALVAGTYKNRVAQVNIYGGTVSGGTAAKGGNIYIGGANKANSKGTCTGILNISGGTIENGDVYIAGSTDHEIVRATISGGTISGTVFVEAAIDSLTVSGTPVIEKLDLTDGTVITLGEMAQGAQIHVTAYGVFTNTLTNADSYLSYIKAYDTNKDVSVLNDALFLPEEDEQVNPYNLVYAAAVQMTANNVFASGEPVTADCPYCGAEDAQWTPLSTGITSTMTIEEGAVTHYYLAADVDNTTAYSVKGTMCLHLNEHGITSTTRAFSITSTGTLNIMGDGNVSGSYSHSTNTTQGSTIDSTGDVNLCGGTYTRTDVQPIISCRATLNEGLSRTVNMYEGTVIAGDSTYVGNALIHVSNSHTFNMHGGSISGGINEEGLGGNIALVAGTYKSRIAQVNIYGGTISGGTAAKGSNIYAGGANKANNKGTCIGILNIYGGTIENGDVYIAGSTDHEIVRATIGGGTISGTVFVEAAIDSFTVYGKPMIENLDLTDGTVMTLGEIKNGAEIFVTANDGTFTEQNEKAATYATYFKAAVSGKKITAEDGTLVMGNETLLQALTRMLASLWSIPLI